jgi:hypothetical protein
VGDGDGTGMTEADWFSTGGVVMGIKNEKLKTV